jgi:tetratricopeptide (TPR) repeat protein
MTHYQHMCFEEGIIRAARLQGEAALGLGDISTAEERLHHALTRARTVNLVEEELPALIGLAELRRRQGELKAARELLDDVWEPAERGPYKLFHADAYNVLAQIEHDAGDREAAIKAATAAYRLAWCDGPPFAYQRGLRVAKAHLAALGAAEPSFPPFDESKYEPMPQIEIEPSGEERPSDR